LKRSKSKSARGSRPARSTARKARGTSSKKPTRSRPAPPREEREDPAQTEDLPAQPARTAEPQADTDPLELDRAAPSGFPIIGIGASAGGLEALEALLRNVPPQSRAAYVIVPHLDPLHRGMMPELLQRVTNLTVIEAQDGMRVEQDMVYVIPPGKDMSLLHGTLHLLPQVSSRTRVLPIDFFFRSLAHDQGSRAIGVILSGMGSDGTLGLRAIKEAAGATFVQSPESAKYDSMPRNAINAGLADVTAPVEELPARIFAFRDYQPRLEDNERDTASAIDKICVLLRQHSGNDFSVYKRSTVYRRIERRMGLHQIVSFADYLRYLRETPREVELLFGELLIGVTSFFRDPAEWERLRQDVMPGLIGAASSNGVLRAWVAGCSTGEEAYSLAMIFYEAVEPLRALKEISLQIFATDLDRAAIDTARAGFYPENITADVSPERLRRFFVREDSGYRISKEIRESVVFAPQNVITDPPFTKVDIVSCRNLMIYLSTSVQNKLIPLFHYCLNQNGVLFLGTAETIGGHSNLFTPLDARTRLYRRVNHTGAVAGFHVDQLGLGDPRARRTMHDEPAAVTRQPATSLQTLVDRLLVQRFAPLGVLCNMRGDVLYVSGRAGKYLEPAVGKASLNILAMAREGLRYELSTAFGKATRQGRIVTTHSVKVGTNGGTAFVDITVQKLQEPKDLDGTVLVVFADAAPMPAARRLKGKRGRASRNDSTDEELAIARDEVQTIREEMQTSQEELKSTNEELQSTNEELQSTNEELTTSKEEMQSLNEELQTVNQELHAKLDELSRSNNDMKNLLNSTDIATLFLDRDLRVRRYTNATSQIIKLIPLDIGRAIADIATELEYPDLIEDAREVLRTLAPKERQALTRDGRAYLVRILPYRTVDNVSDGVVITFTDTTATRALERAAREQASELAQMAESLPNLVWGARADGGFDYISRQWVDYTGISASEQVQWGWLEQLHAGDRERVREAWRTSVRTGARFDSEFRIRAASGSFCWFKTRSVPIRDAGGRILKWYGTSTDIDQLKRAEERLQVVLEAASDACISTDKDFVIRTINPAAARLLGRPATEVTGTVLFDALPEIRPAEAELRRAPADLSLSIGDLSLGIHVERDSGGGYWLFVRERASNDGP
jgi:two-component system, chemotaxis family, CheB/CheR fusion protein